MSEILRMKAVKEQIAYRVAPPDHSLNKAEKLLVQCTPVNEQAGNYTSVFW